MKNTPDVRAHLNISSVSARKHEQTGFSYNADCC
jgi:hypothetical protein